jgi:hypothetical protein
MSFIEVSDCIQSMYISNRYLFIIGMSIPLPLDLVFHSAAIPSDIENLLNFIFLYAINNVQRWQSGLFTTRKGFFWGQSEFNNGEYWVEASY